MVNEDILGGLKYALERGESLQKAMITFFNAGYKKEEIEEAARTLTKPVETKPQMPVVPEKKQIPPQEPLQKISAPQQVSQKVSSYGKPMPAAQQVSLPVPIVSDYGKKSSKEKKVIIILISSLVFLICLLITIFLFKQQLIDFFSGFFS